MTSGFRWEVPASYSLAGTVPDKHEPDRAGRWPATVPSRAAPGRPWSRSPGRPGRGAGPRRSAPADRGAVGVGGVDEVDAQLDGPTQHRLGLVAVRCSPQMPLPVRRMAPKPSRLTVRSPPTSIVPAALAVTDASSAMSGAPRGLRGSCTAGPQGQLAVTGAVGGTLPGDGQRERIAHAERWPGSGCLPPRQRHASRSWGGQLQQRAHRPAGLRLSDR
jgi:hypothetical protein